MIPMGNGKFNLTPGCCVTHPAAIVASLSALLRCRAAGSVVWPSRCLVAFSLSFKLPYCCGQDSSLPALCLSRRPQETGRAGRDGKEAHVILYYSYQDAVKSRHMIVEGAREHGTPPEQLQCNKDALNAMVRGLGGYLF